MRDGPIGGGTPAARHWDEVYERAGPAAVSWYEPEAAESFDLIKVAGVALDDAVIDIGGGASTLVDSLVAAGYRNVSVLDISSAALRAARERLKDPTIHIRWLHQDIFSWQPDRRYDLWHDRAVFHFLVDPDDRNRYRRLIMNAVNPGGFVVVGTFAADGPKHCSGLPVCRYRPDELRAALGEDLELVTSRQILHQTPSGVAQRFTWVVLRVHQADLRLGQTP